MIYKHPTACVDNGSVIGEYTSIWHYAHIESGGVVGENCNLGQNVYIGNDAKVGNACRLGNSVSIFANVELEDFVFCGPFMVFTHISFPRAAVTRKAIFAKTIVKNGATLGANSTILPGVTVGEGGFIAAGSTLTKDCKAWALMVGSPAKQLGWVSAFGEKIPLPLSGTGKWECKQTGDVYTLVDNELHRLAGYHDILKYTYGEKLSRMMAL